MRQNLNDSLKSLTGFTCSHCGKQLVGWIPAKNADPSAGLLCNQCLMLMDWIKGYNKQQSDDQQTKESA